MLWECYKNLILESKIFEETKKIYRELEEIKEKREKDCDIRNILDFHKKIFGKLHPRRKILTNITIDPDNKFHNFIVLHQFGLFVLPSEYYERSRPILNIELFKFLKDNTEETINEVADKIKYEDKRIMFRKYCKMVKRFIEDNNISSINSSIKPITISVPCNKTIKILDGRKLKNIHVEKLILKEDIPSTLFLSFSESGGNIESFDLSYYLGDDEIESIKFLVVYEIIKDDLLKALKLMKKEAKKQVTNKIKNFEERLKNEFSAYLMAQKI